MNESRSTNSEVHGGPIGGECSCPWKPANRKGVQHSQCCFHDEPGITICSCGGRRKEDPGLDTFIGDEPILHLVVDDRE